MNNRRLVYRVHAIERMAERAISAAEVAEVVLFGETLENRPQGFPHPSRLILGWSGSRPLHVVVAEDRENNAVVVITAYEPSPYAWDPAFRRRRLQ